METYGAFLQVVQGIFSPLALSLALQRGLMIAGFVLAWMAISQAVLKTPGTFTYWMDAYRRRVKDNAAIAPSVATVEGQVMALEDRVVLLLKELDIRLGKPQSAALAGSSPFGGVGLASSSGMPPLATPSPAIASPALTVAPLGMPASSPTLPPLSSSLPTLPTLPTLPPLPGA